MARRDRLKQGSDAKERVMERLAGGGGETTAPVSSRRIDRLKAPESIKQPPVASGVNTEVRAMATELFNPQQNLDAFDKATQPTFGPPAPSGLQQRASVNAQLPGRDIPVVGPILKGLDKLQELTEPAAKIAEQFYVPGAGLANVGAFTGAVGQGISKVAPSLGRGAGILPTLGREAIKEAVVGVPLGAGQVLANNPGASAREVGEGALLGGALGVAGGAALGGVAKAVGNRLSRLKTAAPADETLALPAPRQRGNANTAVTDDVIAPEYRFALPDAQTANPTVVRPAASTIERVGRTELLPPQAQQTRPRIDVTDPESLRTPKQTQNAEKGIRANYQNQLKNGNFSQDLQQGIRNLDQSYDKAKNIDSVATANERLKDIPKAEADFLANESSGPEHIATGYRLMQQLDAMGEHQRSLNVSAKLAKDLTKGGQTVQAAALLARLSPEGQLLNLVRTAERNGKEVSIADKTKFQELAAVVQDNTGAGVRANQFDNILNRLEKGETVSPEELKTLGNMLERANKYTKPAKPVKDVLPKELNDVKKREKIVSFLDNAEQAALARIAARKNRLNALPIDEWADHAIVVASQMAKGTIKAATYVEDMVKLLGDEIRPVAAEIFEKAQNMVNQSSKRISEGKLHEANQIVDRISGRKVPTAEKVMEKYISENPVSEKDIEKLRGLAKQVNELSGEDAVNADMAMQKILNSYEKSSAWDKVQALRYIAMLLNSSTQAVNAISGPIMATTGTVADVFGTMIDIPMSKLLKQPRTTTLYGTNPLAFIAQWMKGAKVGGKAGWNGVNPAGIAGPNEIRGLTYKSLFNPFSIAERSLGAVAKGADYGTYKAVQTSEMRKIAFLDAKNKGIKGKANIDKHIEQFMNEPPDEAILQADRIGKNTTFQRSDSFGGKTANFLNAAPAPIKPLSSAVFPFVRTPVNIASTAVTLTPGGIIKGLYQLTSKSDASRREAIRTLTLGLTGTGLLTPLGYYLSKAGIITGSNDSGNKDVDAIREQAGQGKYRFNTSALSRYLRAMLDGKGPDGAAKAAKYQEGDKQFDYNKLQPLAFPLAIGAGLQDDESGTALENIKGAGVDAYGSLYGMSTLKGVQDVFQPSYGGTVGEKALGLPTRVITSFLKSFSPSAIAQEARRQDPIQRKTSYNDGILKDTSSYFKSRLPFGVSETLPPNKTTLGQNKLNAPGVTGQYLNPYKSDVAPYNEAAEIITKLIESTGDETLAPSAPNKKVSGKDRTGQSVEISIPQERYSRYQQELGDDIIKRISTLPNGLTDQQKADRVQKIYKTAEEKHRNIIKRELGIRVSR
jgi:hypothetical protein